MREGKNENSELNPKENLGPLFYYFAGVSFFSSILFEWLQSPVTGLECWQKKIRIVENQGGERRCSQAVKRFGF